MGGAAFALRGLWRQPDRGGEACEHVSRGAAVQDAGLGMHVRKSYSHAASCQRTSSKSMRSQKLFSLYLRVKYSNPNYFLWITDIPLSTKRNNDDE